MSQDKVLYKKGILSSSIQSQEKE